MLYFAIYILFVIIPKLYIFSFTNLLIYKDTTVIILQNPQAIAVEIINQDIANSFMAYFKEFWKKTKEINP